jgi:hypothetical protein
LTVSQDECESLVCGWRTRTKLGCIYKCDTFRAG